MKPKERDLQYQRVSAYDTCKLKKEKLLSAKNTLFETGLLSVVAYHQIRLYVDGYQDKIKVLLIDFYQNEIDNLEKAMEMI